MHTNFLSALSCATTPQEKKVNGIRFIRVVIDHPNLRDRQGLVYEIRRLFDINEIGPNMLAHLQREGLSFE